MKKISIEECQSIELEIMKCIHAFCCKHKLRYLLAYGTLLGAVRHKGFIPWDNDMDIYMPRPDFERFLEIAQNESIAENLYVKYYTNDENYHYNCIRVCNKKTHVNIPYIPVQPTSMGVWVDIFAVDGLPKSNLSRKAQRFRVRGMYYALRAHIYGTLDNKNQLRRIIKLLCLRLFSNENQKLNKRITKMEKKYPFDSSEQTSVIFEDPFVLIPRDDFDIPAIAEFEGCGFFIPAHYDKILKDTYGEYMELPDESKRVPHGIEAYWK